MKRGMFEADMHVDEAAYPRYERAYMALASVFIVLLVLTNVIGTKLFASPFNPNWALTTGILTYPLTFLVTDLVSEIYGKKRADFMVAMGFFMSLLMLAAVQMSIAVPPHAAWAGGGFYADGWTAGPAGPTGTAVEGYQHAWLSAFSLNGVLLLGSMLAYACAQLTDNWLYDFWKRYTNGKHLWLRNNGSTWISQIVDTAIVNGIFFYFGLGLEFWFGLHIMVTIYLHKLLIAILDTPFVYLGVYLLRTYIDGDSPAASEP
jgi:uncharacterized PurR-regulated membrane protein YhhQ (DUF165 family)